MNKLKILSSLLFLGLLLNTCFAIAGFIETPPSSIRTLPNGTQIEERYLPRKNVRTPASKSITISHSEITIRYKLSSTNIDNWDISDDEELSDTLIISNLSISNKKLTLIAPSGSYPNCHFNNFANETVWMEDRYLALPRNCVGNYLGDQNTIPIFSISRNNIRYLGHVAEIIDGSIFEAYDLIDNPYGDTLHGWGLRVRMSEQKTGLVPDVKKSASFLKANLPDLEGHLTEELLKTKEFAPASRPNCGKEPCRPWGGYSQNEKPQGNCDPIYGEFCQSLWNLLDSAFSLAATAQYIGEEETKNGVLKRLEESNYVDDANLKQFKQYLAKAKPRIKPF